MPVALVDQLLTQGSHKRFVVWPGAVMRGADYEGHFHSSVVVKPGGKLYCGENFTPDGVKAGINYGQGFGTFAKIWVHAGGSVDLESCFRGTPHGAGYDTLIFYERPDDVQWLKNDAGERDKSISDKWRFPPNHCTGESSPMLAGPQSYYVNLERCALECWNDGIPNSACTKCEHCAAGYSAASNCKTCTDSRCITTTQTSTTQTTTTPVTGTCSIHLPDRVIQVNVDNYVATTAHRYYIVWPGGVLAGADYRGHVHSTFIVMKGGKLYCGEDFTSHGARAGINYRQGIGTFAKVYVQDGGSVDLQS